MGTKYIDKQTLIDKIKERVFKNIDYATSSLDIQTNDCDIVESLWDRGGCEETVFTATGTYINGTVTRTICGPDVTFIAKINYTDDMNLADSITFSDIISINQATWFKLDKITTIVDSINVDRKGDFGSMSMNDISSYGQDGLTGDGELQTGDITKVAIPGNTKGSGHSWSVNEVPDSFNSSYDNDFGSTENNYLVKSPKDLSLSGLDLTFENSAQAYGADRTTPVGSVTVMIKGILL